MTPEESLQRAMTTCTPQVPEGAKDMFPPFLQTCEPDEVVESLCPGGSTEVMIATNKRLVNVTHGFRKPRVKAWSWSSMSRFSVGRVVWSKSVVIRVAGLDIELTMSGRRAQWLREQLQQRGVAEASR